MYIHVYSCVYMYIQQNPQNLTSKTSMYIASIYSHIMPILLKKDIQHRIIDTKNLGLRVYDSIHVSENSAARNTVDVAAQFSNTISNSKQQYFLL